ncbi:MAG: Hpt domain-containing protein [Candidatus Sumerlaeia bacterium]|nr:Hpt domain-containing protein [Candidatus Sumerlaeia bacterium]
MERELAAVFLEHLAVMVDKVETAFAARDGAATLRALHTLRGASANLGADALAELAAMVEQPVTAGLWFEAEAQLKELRPLAERTGADFDAAYFED